MADSTKTDPPYRIGFFLDGTEPAGDIAETAKQAEAHGCQTLWIANHLFHRDPVVQATAALAATDTLSIALTAVNPYTMHPIQAAMAAATLDEHFPGRILLSLGAGAPGLVRVYGPERRFLGVGEVLRDGRLAPKRLFVEPAPRDD